ncbi:MAG: hypothetical protein JWN79_1657, partial [Gemmatimonadetes bacterium]|nr:hypothetical protein [Gemmatimonadota bacterium]
ALPAAAAASPAPVPVPAGMSAADSAALARDLRSALQHASDESTARTALAEAGALATRATLPEDKVRVEMVRAQAYGTLGQDARSCQALRDGVAIAKGTGFESALTDALARCR